MSGAVVYEGPQLPALALKNDALPAAIRVFDDKAVAEWMLTVTSAEVVRIVDDGSLQIANEIAVRLQAALKACDARDVELRAPLKQTMDAIRFVTDSIRSPLERGKKALVNKIGAFDRDRKEMAEKAHREAQEKHKAEVARLQAETAAKAKAARDQAEKDARALAEAMGEEYVPPKEATPSAEPTDFAKDVLAKFPDVPRPPEKPAAPAVQAATITRKVQKLRITDFSKIPYKVGDEILMSPNEAAIMRVLKSGAAIPGAEIIYEDQVSMRPTNSANPITDPKTGEKLF